jgi:hypothetical protein
VTSAERLAELAGPIVVKEVRQGLRARIFAIFFGLLLTGCLVVALIAAAEFDRRSNQDLGPEYFRLFLTALAIVEFFVIPYTAFRAMSREREDETWVLLVLTGLGARRIVRGKVSSALAQGLLYASACAPFVLFSYYLNGIDLPTVLVALVMAGAWSFLLVCVGVAAATQAHSRIGRALVHFLVLGVMLGATAAGIAWANVLAEDGGRVLRQELAVRILCLAMVVWAISTAYLASEGAASGLALLSENAAMGPRRALMVQVLIALAAAGVVALLSGARDPSAAVAGSVATALHLLVCGLFAFSEHDGFPPAFARAGFFSRPGALRSFLLVAVLLALSTAVWAFMYQRLGAGSTRNFRVLLAAPMFVFMYLSLGVLLGRLSPLKALGEPLATRLGFVIATALGVFVPMFLSVLTGHNANDRAMNVLNPIVALGRMDSGRNGATTLMLGGCCALLFGFLSFTVLSTRDVERRT